MKRLLSGSWKKKLLLSAGAVLIFTAAWLGHPVELHAESEVLPPLSSGDDSAVAEEEAAHWQPLFESPLSGVITCPFGYRQSGFHHGLDIANEWGTKIGAIAAGTVVEAGWKSSVYGYAVLLDHGNGWQSLYAHCGMLTVEVGDYVETGQVIAVEGSTGRSTGPHLHLEIRKDGVYLDPADLIEVPSSA